MTYTKDSACQNSHDISPRLLDGQGYGLEDMIHLIVDVPHAGHHGPRVPGLAGGAVAGHGLMVVVT